MPVAASGAAASYPEVHQKAAEELGNLLERKRGLEAEVIRQHWAAHQLRYRDRPWAKLFQLKSSRKNRAPRLREAVPASLPEGLLTMRPCCLVGPEAAAQIFPLQSGLFDVVIFDEASQCPIEQAVPAIYRGNILIVSGDEKQLPPTGFFSAKWDAENLEDNSEAGDEEASDLPVTSHKRL